MNGQWLGKYTGTNSGRILLNIDEMNECYEGEASLYEDNNELPSVAIFFKTPNKSNPVAFKITEIYAIDRRSDEITTWEKIKDLFPPGINLSKWAQVEASWNDKELSLAWKTDLGLSCHSNLPRSKAGHPSEFVPETLNWDSYKTEVAKLEDTRFIFRGQTQAWRLRSSFHRTGRAQIMRFIEKDIQALYKHLSARTKHIFSLNDPNENGAFFNLVQHHGYPTPLLDWTYSPYVAAFFAYRGVSSNDAQKASPEKKVRIYKFDHEKWKLDTPQYQRLSHTSLHFSVMEFTAIENERMIPQQAVSTITGIDDIESYMSEIGKSGSNYMSVIDLPVYERDKVMQELRFMGITAGSMFPGIDGACEELKERNFKI